MTIILLVGATAKHVFAQEKNKNSTRYFTVPEFYYFESKKSRDTTFEFKCYDVRDSLIKFVLYYDSVRYYSLFKSYIDSAHTYKDNNGDKKPLPVSTIVKRYDRIGKNKWMCIEYPGNKFAELTEYKNIIVNTDTTTLYDPVENNAVLYIFKHYKVAK